MKSNTRFVTLIVTLVGISLAASTAFAGREQRHRWEGVAIGVGAAILGHAIYQAHRSAAHQPEVVYVEPEPDHRYGRPGPRPHHGRWEWRETWVPAQYDRVWNPGHYNRRGKWVPGGWIEIKKTDGYWQRERVWVAGNDHRP